MTDNDNRLTNRLMSTGADIAGSLTGTALGMLLAGPPGALAGAALAPVVGTLLSMGAEFSQRRLSPRESARVGALIAFASERICENLDAGREIRDDGFFADPPPGSRRASEELAEEIAQAVQRQAQERKVRYLGNLLANLAFDSQIDRVTAHRTLRAAEELSYTQFQLLGLYLRDDIPLPDGTPQVDECSWRAYSIAGELANLGFAQQEFLLATGEGISPASDIPSEQRLTTRGRLIAELLGLDSLPEEDSRDVATALWERQGREPPW